VNRIKRVIYPLEWSSVQLPAAFMTGCGNAGGCPDSRPVPLSPGTKVPVESRLRKWILTSAKKYQRAASTALMSSIQAMVICHVLKGQQAADNTVVASTIIDLKTACIVLALMYLSVPDN